MSRAATLPGVEAAGIASVLPVSFNGNTDWIRFVGRPYNGEHNEVNHAGGECRTTSRPCGRRSCVAASSLTRTT